MKIGEFVQLLAGFDPEAEVVLAKDAEGNSYRLIGEVWEDGAFCQSENAARPGEVEVYGISWNAEQVGMDEENEDEWNEWKRHGVRCVVLYPVD